MTQSVKKQSIQTILPDLDPTFEDVQFRIRIRILT
jgi:hypothetical protein